jgi:co-chaperonin GroES (HSP10)
MTFRPLHDCVAVRRVDAEERCRLWTTEVSEARERAQPLPPHI